jgi:hypothetical protein
MEEFMKQAVEMGSGDNIYTPSFIKFGSAIQKLMGQGINAHEHTDSMVISYEYFYFL